MLTIPSPHFEWLGGLEEEGPPEDSSILLVGRALLGGAPYTVKAVRISAGERVPDYRSNIGHDAYADLELDRWVDEVEGIADTIEPQLVKLAGASYLLCLFPSEHAS